jgi:hypothetical protein
MFDRIRQWARQALFPRLTLTHLSAFLLIGASGLANARYGLLLGQSSLEQTIALAGAIGADLFSAVGFIAVATAVAGKQYVKSVATALVLAITLTFATGAGPFSGRDEKGRRAGAHAPGRRAGGGDGEHPR